MFDLFWRLFSLDFNEKDPLESFHRTNQDNMPTHK